MIYIIIKQIIRYYNNQTVIIKIIDDLYIVKNFIYKQINKCFKNNSNI